MSPGVTRLAGLLCLAAVGAAQAATIPVGGAVNHAAVWVPDYFGLGVKIYNFDYTAKPAKFTTTSLDLSGKSCNPNALAIQGKFLYIVCNGDFGHLDQILVYKAKTLAYAKTITGIDAHGTPYFAGASLIGILFDAHGNLWTSGYNFNTLLRIPAANLSQPNPRVDREVIDSPDSPAGLALDGDNSIWVVGQFQGGIVLNFTDDILNQAGSFLAGNPLNPTPRSCISNDAFGCQQQQGLFNNPEGVAVFQNQVWVSNNGGNAPAATLVRLTKKAGDQLQPLTYGGTVDQPFACPGGLFTAIGPGDTPTLWVNDEGFGVHDTDCGASGADQGAKLGRVMEFLPPALKPAHAAAPQPDKFTHWNQLFTSSPGFGGIFVQLE